MNNRVNSASKFFDVLSGSGLVKRMVDESPTGIIKSTEFNKELLRLFKDTQVSQTAIDASKWTYAMVEHMEGLVNNGMLDVWKDMQFIYEYYMEEIVYEHWLFEKTCNARENRLISMKDEIIQAEIMENDTEVLRLKTAYNSLKERNAFLRAKGFRYKLEM